MTTATSTIPCRDGSWRRWGLLLWCWLAVACAQAQVGAEELEAVADTAIWQDVQAAAVTRYAQDGWVVLQGPRHAEALQGEINGWVEPIVRMETGQRVEIAFTLDLDADGFAELVYSTAPVGARSCCPSQWQVVACLEGERYWRSKPLGEALHPPVAVQVAGQWLLEVENRAADAYRTYATRERYAMRELKMELVATVAPQDLPALSELRLGRDEDPPADSVFTLRHDLNADGKPELIEGRYLPKWERMYWTLRLGDGTVLDGGPPFRRLGVLPTMTKGFHDLVVDADRVYVWNGKRYEEKE